MILKDERIKKMKAKLSKMLSLALTALIIVSAFASVPFTASAAESQTEAVRVSSGTTGDCTWTLNDTELTISGSGAMGNGYPWGKEITKAIIKSGVTSIGNYAFYECSSLTSVSIPDSVTNIGDYAFSFCAGLTSITIPDNVTSIGDGAFECCAGLTCVTIPDSVTRIGKHVFWSCTSLSSITVPDSVTSIGSAAFYYTVWYNNQPDGLVYAGKVANNYKGDMTDNTSIVIKDGTKGIADSAFQGRTNLSSVTIPDGVTSIGNEAFFDCTSLSSVTIPDSVTSIGNEAFGYYYDYDNPDHGKIDGFTIYGYEGSQAQKYAQDNGFMFVAYEAPPQIVTGDTNGDEKIDINDVTVIQRCMAEYAEVTDELKVIADVNGDGKVDINDATHLQKYLAEFKDVGLGKQ